MALTLQQLPQISPKLEYRTYTCIPFDNDLDLRMDGCQIKEVEEFYSCRIVTEKCFYS